jgi:hypothetical protein
MTGEMHPMTPTVCAAPLDVNRVMLPAAAAPDAR